MKSPLSHCAFSLLLAGGLASGFAQADPRVAVSIAPVHSWISQVSGDLWEPELLLPAEVDPHNALLRPSQRQAIQRADWVVWVGPQLETSLEGLMGQVSASQQWSLVDGDLDLVNHEFRQAGEVFAEARGGHDEHGHADEAHGHDDHGNGHDGHGHAEEAHGHDEHGHADDAHGHDDHGNGHDEHGHADEAHGHDDHSDGHAEHGHAEEAHGHDDHSDGHAEHGHAEEAHGHGDGHDHAHTGVDPHLWLDPENARRALGYIAQRLSEIDPDNAATYTANADAAIARLHEQQEDWRARIDRAAPEAYVVFHDGYQYFDRAFNIPFAGSITLNPEQLPGMRTIERMRAALADQHVGCIFAEPQHSDRLVQTIASSFELPVGRLDALGAAIEPGPNHYGELMDRMVTSFTGCNS